MKFPITYTIDKASLRINQLEKAKQIVSNLKGTSDTMGLYLDRDMIENACRVLCNNEYQMQVMACDIDIHYHVGYSEMVEDYIEVWARCKVWGFSSCYEVGFSFENWFNCPYDNYSNFKRNSYIKEYKVVG